MFKQRIFTLAFLFFATFLVAQNPLTFQQIPNDYQLFQRDLSDNMAQIEISGHIANDIPYSKIGFFLSGENGNTDSSYVDLNGNPSFYHSLRIPAGKNNHLLHIFALNSESGNWDWARTVNKLLAGDVFIIDGQSNATANASPNSGDVEEYTRGWFPNLGWGLLNHSYPGEWGARLAHRISQDAHIPVAILNNATTAAQIKDFIKNPSDSSQGNYGKLLARFEAAGAPKKARAAFWFHGEADAWETSTADYIQSFERLQANWQVDFGIEHTFLFQMRFNSCNSPQPYILEAQRQLALRHADIDIMSSNNADHDDCHFYYENGYKALGDRLANLVLHKLYNGSNFDVFAPNLVKITKKGQKNIEISTEKASALEIVGAPWSDFRAEPNGQRAINGYIDGTKIMLEWALDIDSMTGVSYLGHKGNALHWITNPTGVGLLSFFNQSIASTPNTGGPTSMLVDLELHISASDTLPGEWNNTDLTLSLENKGNATATGIRVAFMDQSNPAVFDKMALVRFQESNNTHYDFWLGNWDIPSIAAGEKFVLEYRIFTKTKAPLQVFAQVMHQNEAELDSKPDNNDLGIPLEDDEALILINWDNLFKKGTQPAAPFALDEMEDLTIFPNPTQRFVRLQTTKLINSNVEIDLINLGGKLEKRLFSGKIQDKTTSLDLETIESGLYTLKIKVEGKRTLVRKLVLEKGY